MRRKLETINGGRVLIGLLCVGMFIGPFVYITWLITRRSAAKR